MPRFRRYAALVALILAAVTSLLMGTTWRLAEIDDPLLPQAASAIPWQSELSSDIKAGGSSEISVAIQKEQLVFNFRLGKTIPYPYVSFLFEFSDRSRPETLVDFSRYHSLSVAVTCVPHNIMTLEFYSYDAAITKPGDFGTYRVSRAYFPCDSDQREVVVDLRNLEVQEWWLLANGAEFSDRSYQLDRMLGFALINSMQSPRETPSAVTLSSARLHGRIWLYVYLAAGLVCLMWTIFGYWYVQRRTALMIEDIVQKMQQDRPVIAYQQVPAAPAQDRERVALLRYMTTEFADPELSLEGAVAALGINRTKINEILKDELELTFSSYLTKLRLAEAARLLSESNLGVAEIAYAVGYSNASYFTTVFKKEYGCTPKAFKKHMDGTEGKNGPPET